MAENERRKIKKQKAFLVASLVLMLLGIAAWQCGEETASRTSTPASTPTLPSVGLIRTNPAAFGEPVVNDEGVECTVLSVERDVTLEFDQPTEGRELIIISLRLRNLGSPDKARRYTSADFRVVGSRGVIYDRMFFLSSIDDALKSGELYGGAEVTGNIIQEVSTGESDLVLIWDPGPLVDARYLSLQDRKSSRSAAVSTPEGPPPTPTEEAASLPPPQDMGPVSAGGNAELEIHNDTPYVLTLEFQGPTSHTVSIERCPECREYSVVGPVFCPSGRPRLTFRLPPGTYEVTLRVDRPRITPFAGTWDLVGDRKYSHCFFIVTQIR